MRFWKSKNMYDIYVSIVITSFLNTELNTHLYAIDNYSTVERL